MILPDDILRVPVRVPSVCLMVLLAVLAVGCVQPPVETAPPAVETPLHRLVGILDYIGADYPGAVRGGRVINEFEHQEQIAFAEAALGIAGDPSLAVPGPLRADLGRLRDLCRDAGPEEEVGDLTRELRKELVDHFGLIRSPATPPSRERGEKLFATHCASCHGADGRPPADMVAKLEPPPRELSSSEVLGPLSPYRVYNALSFGIEGTAMPSFDQLGAEDRWNLSFYVFTLRPGSGEPPLEKGGGPFSLAALASSTDDDLEERLSGEVAPAEVGRRLDGLRLLAPFSAEGAPAPLAVARHLLDQALAAAARGDRHQAQVLLVDAYLSGIEPAEGPLTASAPELVTQLESTFLGLRAAILAGDEAEIASRSAGLRQLLGRAEFRIEAEPHSPWFAALSSATLIIREGAEAALLVLLLLAASAGGAGERRVARFVHGGWLLALLLGAATFMVVRAFTAKVAAPAEMIEAIASLLAAAVLFYVSHWLLGQVQAAQWMEYLKERARSHVTAGRMFMLAGLSFLAVYREAVETVLFLEGLLSGGSPILYVAAGAAAGAAALAMVVFILKRLGQRLPLRAFFAASSLLLYALCIVLAGRGMRALVAAGILTPRPISLPSIPSLGIYPDILSLAAQGLLLLAVGASMLWLWRKKQATRGAELAGQG